MHAFLNPFFSSPLFTSTSAQLPGVLPTLYEYYFDQESQHWTPWESMVTPYVPPTDGRFCNILVPTVDTVRSSWILERLVPLRQVGAPHAHSPIVMEAASGLRSRHAANRSIYLTLACALALKCRRSSLSATRARPRP